MKNFKRWSCLALSLAACSGAVAQASLNSLTVNGDPFPASLYEQRLQAVLARGQSDTPQLREALLQDVINRQLLLKEAQRRGVDKDAAFLKQLATVRDDLLVEWLLQKQSDPAAVSASELKSEYDRQVQSLGPAADLKEYQLRLVMLSDRESASRLLQDLSKGVSFDKLAREKSKDASREQGGLVGWVLPQNIVPAIAGVMANLPKGATSVAPVETPAGWAVMRVDDIRPYKIPSFEESRERLLPAVVLLKRTELVDGLRKSAVIQAMPGAQPGLGGK